MDDLLLLSLLLGDPSTGTGLIFGIVSLLLTRTGVSYQVLQPKSERPNQLS